MTATAKQVAKAGQLVAAGKVHVDDVPAPAFSAMVDSASTPGAAYHVSHGPMLGWRCSHPHWREGTACVHILAALAWLDQAGHDPADYWEDNS